MAHRNVTSPTIIREKTKIYRLSQYPSSLGVAGSTSYENKSLLFASDEDNISTESANDMSSKEDLDEVEDKRPDMPAKKKKLDTTNDSLEIASIYKYLHILTAIFGAFAHDRNDVSEVHSVHNFSHQSILSSVTTSRYFFGHCRRVIRTIDEDLTKIAPSSGFIIEISTAFTVLVASNLSIPISTTHCRVVSVEAIDCVRSKQSVDSSLFRNIIVAWIVTVPVTGGIAAGVVALFCLVFL
ncbi:unnamed protein product [Rotaria sp. Silwood2]|nr:unnamed protein product [Rotaria sp. Silwood2]CAF4561661.1 unnamed protein product [Rotaria sp. Silwood2]